MISATSQDWLVRFPALAAARDPGLQRFIAATPLLVESRRLELEQFDENGFGDEADEAETQHQE